MLAGQVKGQRSCQDRILRKKVIHRDIKLENTLLDSVESGRNPLIKICDFGYSIDDQSSLPKTKVGTPGYTGERLLLPSLLRVLCSLVMSQGIRLCSKMCYLHKGLPRHA